MFCASLKISANLSVVRRLKNSLLTRKALSIIPPTYTDDSRNHMFNDSKSSKIDEVACRPRTHLLRARQAKMALALAAGWVCMCYLVHEFTSIKLFYAILTILETLSEKSAIRFIWQSNQIIFFGF